MSWEDDADPILEREVERPAKDFAEEHDWWVAKFVSPGRRGVPDDVFIRDGRVLFIEFKRPGKDLRPQQRKRIREMREHGAEVHVIDNLADAYALLR
jgi:hypothetical protein